MDENNTVTIMTESRNFESFAVYATRRSAFYWKSLGKVARRNRERISLF